MLFLTTTGSCGVSQKIYLIGFESLYFFVCITSLVFVLRRLGKFIIHPHPVATLVRLGMLMFLAKFWSSYLVTWCNHQNIALNNNAAQCIMKFLFLTFLALMQSLKLRFLFIKFVNEVDIFIVYELHYIYVGASIVPVSYYMFCIMIVYPPTERN